VIGLAVRTRIPAELAPLTIVGSVGLSTARVLPLLEVSSTEKWSKPTFVCWNVTTTLHREHSIRR
jgi:hypothetical protein